MNNKLSDLFSTNKNNIQIEGTINYEFIQYK